MRMVPVLVSLSLLSCGAQQHPADAAKIARTVADVACEIAPLGAAVAGTLAPNGAQYISLADKGATVACALYHSSSGGSQ